MQVDFYTDLQHPFVINWLVPLLVFFLHCSIREPLVFGIKWNKFLWSNVCHECLSRYRTNSVRALKETRSNDPNEQNHSMISSFLDPPLQSRGLTTDNQFNLLKAPYLISYTTNQDKDKPSVWSRHRLSCSRHYSMGRFATNKQSRSAVMWNRQWGHQSVDSCGIHVEDFAKCSIY